MTDYVVTDEEVGVGLAMSPGGASWGRVKRPDTILRAARRLVEVRASEGEGRAGSWWW